MSAHFLDVFSNVQEICDSLENINTFLTNTFGEKFTRFREEMNSNMDVDSDADSLRPVNRHTLDESLNFLEPAICDTQDVSRDFEVPGIRHTQDVTRDFEVPGPANHYQGSLSATSAKMDETTATAGRNWRSQRATSSAIDYTETSSHSSRSENSPAKITSKPAKKMTKKLSSSKKGNVVSRPFDASTSSRHSKFGISYQSTMQGNEKLVYKGYSFTIVSTRNNVTHWICTQRSIGCNASLLQNASDGSVISVKNHCH